MLFFAISFVWAIGEIVIYVHGETVISSPIRIVDGSERSLKDAPPLFRHNTEYRAPQSSSYYQKPYREPAKSYVIYDGDPRQPAESWRVENIQRMSGATQDWHLEYNRRTRPNTDYNRMQGALPTVSYQAVYSNTIKVYDDPMDYLNVHRFPKPTYSKQYHGDRQSQSTDTRQATWDQSPQVPKYDVYYPNDQKGTFYPSGQIPDNFPPIFSPNIGYKETAYEQQGHRPQTKNMFYPSPGYFHTYTVKFQPGDETRTEENENPDKQDFEKQAACNYIRLNSQGFPENKEPCARSRDDAPLLSPDYPDYSNLANDKTPMEHRRHFRNQDVVTRRVRRNVEKTNVRSRRSAAGYGFGLHNWSTESTPSAYGRNYAGNFNEYYPEYRSNVNSGYPGGDRSKGYEPFYNQMNRDPRFMDQFGGRGVNSNDMYNRGGYKSNGYNVGRYNIASDDDYHNTEETSTRGLTSYLTSGGKRDKSKVKNTDDNETDDDRMKNRQGKNDPRDKKNVNDGMRGSGSRNQDEDDDDDDDQDDDQDDYRRRGNRQGSSRRGNGRRFDDYGGRGSNSDRDYGGRGSGSDRDSGGRGSGSDRDYGGRGSGSDRDYGGRGSSSDRDYGGRGSSSDRDYGDRGSSSDYGGRGSNNNDEYGGRDSNYDRDFGGRGSDGGGSRYRGTSGSGGYGSSYGNGGSSYGNGGSSYGNGDSGYGNGGRSYGNGGNSYGYGGGTYGNGGSSYGGGYGGRGSSYGSGGYRSSGSGSYGNYGSGINGYGNRSYGRTYGSYSNFDGQQGFCNLGTVLIVGSCWRRQKKQVKAKPEWYS